MKTFFTSDTHVGHRNILQYSNRPFTSVEHMDEMLIRNWNDVVSDEDVVYHLGDVAMGSLDTSLPKLGRLNGYKILILGNHDRPFMRRDKNDYERWVNRYREFFDEIHDYLEINLNGRHFMLSHFPYVGDSHDKDRYDEFRLTDAGVPLIHGHTHSTENISYSPLGTPQIHVGVDSRGYAPVSSEQILKELEESSARSV